MSLTILICRLNNLVLLKLTVNRIWNCPATPYLVTQLCTCVYAVSHHSEDTHGALSSTDHLIMTSGVFFPQHCTCYPYHWRSQKYMLWVFRIVRTANNQTRQNHVKYYSIGYSTDCTLQKVHFAWYLRGASEHHGSPPAWLRTCIQYMYTRIHIMLVHECSI